MTTFSQLVDSMVQETNRRDLVQQVVAYARQTIRECHFDPERNTPIFMWPNYAEAAVTADSEQGFFWLVPDVARFQGVLKVRYDGVFVDGRPAYALPLVHNRVAEDQNYAFQLAGDRVLFKGYGGLGAAISIAYFQYPPLLAYYPVGVRPASFSVESGYTYLSAYDVDDDTRQAARDLTTHWLLLRWSETIEEGIRAKIYKRLGDESRARLAYSAFMQLRLALVNAEQADLAGAR